MRFQKEVIALDPEFPLKIFPAPGCGRENFFLHTHDCLEINLMAQGEGIYWIGNKQYNISQGDLVIINNREHHIAVNGGNLLLKVLVFDPDMVWQNNNTLFPASTAFSGGRLPCLRANTEPGDKSGTDFLHRFGPQAHQMRNAGNRLALLACRQRHQRSRAEEQHIRETSCEQIAKHGRAQHRRGASAARSARVHILTLSVIQHQPAVVVYGGNVVSLAQSKLPLKIAAHCAEIAG